MQALRETSGPWPWLGTVERMSPWETLARPAEASGVARGVMSGARPLAFATRGRMAGGGLPFAPLLPDTMDSSSVGPAPAGQALNGERDGR